jgi:hypothetical protein
MSQFITAFDSTGRPTTYCIEEGSSTFAGTGTHCEIHLDGDDVAAIHCMFSVVDGELKIQDWNTDGKTSLNGAALADESAFVDSDEVTIGSNRIIVGKPEGSAQPTPRASAETVPFSPDENQEELQRELEKIRIENVELEKELAAEPNNNDGADSLYDDPFASGDTELLRDEIESLTLELAERDQQVAMLNQQLESGGGGGDMEETTRLVSRMEQLLDELQTADERIRTHEELLRFSDEATQAEQEERRQLESWVNQIEDRVAAREDESKAETERLNGRVRDLLAQQKHHEQVLEKALQQRTSSGNGQSDELVESLQAQVRDLQAKWQDAQDECERLSQQTSADSASNDSESVDELKQKIMQLELDASRERAEVARERAELAKMQSELEQQCRTNNFDSDADIRLKAMRDHLRELHSEEEVEREARRQRSLGGRIASLFTRIESRQ